MFKGNSAVNNPIVADNSAVVLGIVSGILIDPYLSRVAAFTLKRGPREAMVVLPWMGVKRIETEQVVAWAPTMIVRADELFDIRRLLQQGTIQQGTRFRSIDGEFLGTMVDFYCDQHSGVIASYELIGGPFVATETEHRVIPAVPNTQVEMETNTAYLPLSYKELAHLVENAS
jgi:uncharacterized protein YrrD